MSGSDQYLSIMKQAEDAAKNRGGRYTVHNDGIVKIEAGYCEVTITVVSSHRGLHSDLVRLGAQRSRSRSVTVTRPGSGRWGFRYAPKYS